MKFLLLTFTLIISNISMAKVNSAEFLFAVVEKNDSILIFINSKSFWNENKRLIDSYESDEDYQFVNEQMNTLKLCSTMESTFEPCSKALTKKEYINLLKKMGFTHGVGFENWISNEL